MLACRVCGPERVHYGLAAHRKRFVVDRLARRGTAAGDLFENLRRRIADPDIRERDRQANARRKRKHFLNRGLGLRFQHQLRENAERNLLAVHIRMRRRGRSEPVVNGVRGGASTISALALAELCYKTLLADGRAGLEALAAREATPALERLVEQ